MQMVPHGLRRRPPRREQVKRVLSMLY